MYNVLLVEEKNTIIDIFCTMLESHEIFCIRNHSAEEALHIVHNEWVDLVILSVPSPSFFWIQLCEQIKDCSVAPIVILTETFNKSFILKALNGGADDIITISTDIDILVAKIKAHLRRSSGSSTKEMHFKGIVLNRELFEIKYEGRLLPFTRKEYDIMDYFLNHPNQVITRKKLLSHIWDGYHHIDARTIDSHIRNIRMKFRKVEFPIDEILKTARGIGYIWKIGLGNTNQKSSEFKEKEQSKINDKLIRLN